MNWKKIWFGILVIGIPLVMLGATIKWYNDAGIPQKTVLSETDILSIQQTGPNAYRWTYLSNVAEFMGISNGVFSISGNGPGVIEIQNSGTNIIVLNGTNGTITGTLLFTGASTFPSATNTLTLNNDYVTLITATDVAITNVLGGVAGQYRWASLRISNSAASPITARWLTAGRKIGIGTTNALVLAAGKLGFIEVLCQETVDTNYITAAEQ